MILKFIEEVLKIFERKIRIEIEGGKEEGV